jgi:hypothetical protein
MDMGGPRRRCLRGLRGALRGVLLRLAVAFLGRGFSLRWVGGHSGNTSRVCRNQIAVRVFEQIRGDGNTRDVPFPNIETPRLVRGRVRSRGFHSRLAISGGQRCSMIGCWQ